MGKRILFLENHLLENLQQKISIDEMASLVNVSPIYLRQLFKAETKQTITQYIRKLRLKKAKELLETEFLRIKEVGVLVGIPNQSKFTQYFKEEFGMTPSECQDLHGKRQIDE